MKESILRMSHLKVRHTNALFILQVVRPAVKGFTHRGNCLKGHHIPAEIWCIIYTTGSYRHWAKHLCPLTTV